jgi:stearoyl-CoA desaturase (delta-9 desaturase)
VGARNNVGDMENDAFYKFIQKTYPIHPIMMAVVLYAVGGFPYVVWGMVIFSTLRLVYLSYSSLFFSWKAARRVSQYWFMENFFPG